MVSKYSKEFLRWLFKSVPLLIHNNTMLILDLLRRRRTKESSSKVILYRKKTCCFRSYNNIIDLDCVSE